MENQLTSERTFRLTERGLQRFEAKRASNPKGKTTQETLGELANIKSPRTIRNILRRGGTYRDSLERLFKAEGLTLEPTDLEPCTAGPLVPRSAPPRTQNPPLGNLPALPTAFYGREQEIAELETLLSRHRLLTLAGHIGIGKTRLALEVASRLARRFPAGVWRVDLADLSPTAMEASPVEMVWRRLGTALALSDSTESHSTAENLLAILQTRQALLLLDNCQQAKLACAQVAGRLLSSCPHLRLIVTSREALGCEGEKVYRVPPLSPEAAAELFQERATLRRSDFALMADPSAIARLCAQLDYLPQQIVLAASQVDGFSVRDIERRSREYGLLESIYRLLSPEQQELLRNLTYFPGEWTLEDIEFMMDDAEDVTALHENLYTLIQKSLVECRPTPEGYAYFLFETVRTYIQTCHPEKTSPPSDSAWQFSLAWCKFRATLPAYNRFLRATIVHPQLARYVGAGAFALFYGQFERVESYALQGLELARKHQNLPTQVFALCGLGLCVAFHGKEAEKRGRAQAYLDEGLECAMQLGNDWYLGLARATRGVYYWYGDDFPAAHPEMLESRKHFCRTSDTWILILITNCLAYVTLQIGEEFEAASLYRESLERSQQTGMERGIMGGLIGCAALAQRREDWKNAALLWGRVGRMLTEQKIPLPPPMQKDYEDYLRQLTAFTGEAVFQTWFQQGQRLSTQAAIQLALDHLL